MTAVVVECPLCGARVRRVEKDGVGVLVDACSRDVLALADWHTGYLLHECAADNRKQESGDEHRS